MSAGPLSGWKAVVHLATHAVMGMVIFCVVAIPAVLLGWLVEWLATIGTSAFVLAVLTAVETLVFIADAILYLFLLGKSLYKASKSIDL